VTDPARDGEMA